MKECEERTVICENVTVKDGRLRFAGQDCGELARRFGTPVYLYDEDRLRANCRRFVSAVKRAFGEGGFVLYASKAAAFRQMYRIVGSEGLGTDVVSCGEIAAAQAAGFDLSNAFFHSNNKTDADIAYAMDRGVGYFVVDCSEELFALAVAAAERGIRQKVLLRITPGIDPHTHAAVRTGQVDSKFGSAIETGRAEEMTRLALSLRNLELAGFHCHIGSQIFTADPFVRAARIMTDFAADMRDALGYTAEIIDLGGGIGVRYVEDQPSCDPGEIIGEMAAAMKERCAERGLPLPRVAIEPGRAIAADAGMTLYTAGSVKRIPGYKSYVSVDGGMTDNPRFALYGSPYTVIAAEKADEECSERFSVVGRCCESGDIIGENIPLPPSVGRGDVIACLTTGAYHFSMSSNYNRVCRPPVVMLKSGGAYLAVKAQTPEDLLRGEV